MSVTRNKTQLLKIQRANYGFGFNSQWCSKMFLKDICAMDGSMDRPYCLGFGVSLFMFF